MVYLLAVHQGKTDEDGDGDREPHPVAARVDSKRTGVLVFREPAYERDVANGGVPGKRDSDAVARAVGILFGAVPGGGGLIDDLDETFSEGSLSLIRNAVFPGMPLPW